MISCQPFAHSCEIHRVLNKDRSGFVSQNLLHLMEEAHPLAVLGFARRLCDKLVVGVVFEVNEVIVRGRGKAVEHVRRRVFIGQGNDGHLIITACIDTLKPGAPFHSFDLQGNARFFELGRDDVGRIHMNEVVARDRHGQRQSICVARLFQEFFRRSRIGLNRF